MPPFCLFFGMSNAAKISVGWRVPIADYFAIADIILSGIEAFVSTCVFYEVWEHGSESGGQIRSVISLLASWSG